MPKATNRLVAVVFDDPYRAEEARALIVYARSDDQRRANVIERMEVFKPTIIESDLPDEVEREITKAIEHEQMSPT